MAPEKIAEKRWGYTLFRLEGGEVVLTVLCGGAAMYELNIPLDSETAAKAIADQKFLEEYASSVRSHPEHFASRSIRI